MPDVMFAEYLKSFGLTGQEATIYELLLRREAMTGYEVAKETGISRSNVYSSLAALVDKGAAYLIEGDPVRYISVEIEKFCDNMLHELGLRAKYLKTYAPEKRQTGEGYITIQGSRHIRDKIRDMLHQCEKRLYILAEAHVLKEFDEELQRLVQDGKKVVVLTENYEMPGAIFYRTKVDMNQIRIITDSSYVLTGEIRDSDSDTCLYSGQANLVSVMKEALKNRITLIELNKEEKK